MNLFRKLFGKGKSPVPAEPTFDELWARLVPPSGQAETVQGELIRAIGRLQDEFLRNGCCNWDEGFEMLSEFTLAHLGDGSFGPVTTEGIRKDIAALRRYGRREEVTDDLEAAYERLSEAAVRWCRKHADPIPHSRRADLKR